MGPRQNSWPAAFLPPPLVVKQAPTTKTLSVRLLSIEETRKKCLSSPSSSGPARRVVPTTVKSQKVSRKPPKIAGLSGQQSNDPRSCGWSSSTLFAQNLIESRVFVPDCHNVHVTREWIGFFVLWPHNDETHHCLLGLQSLTFVANTQLRSYFYRKLTDTVGPARSRSILPAKQTSIPFVPTKPA